MTKQPLHDDDDRKLIAAARPFFSPHIDALDSWTSTAPQYQVIRPGHVFGFLGTPVRVVATFEDCDEFSLAYVVMRLEIDVDSQAQHLREHTLRRSAHWGWWPLPALISIPWPTLIDDDQPSIK